MALENFIVDGYAIRQYNILVEPGEEKQLYERAGRGKLAGFIFYTNKPGIGIIIKLDEKTSKATPDDLITYGTTDVNPTAMYLSTYDVVGSSYSISYFPPTAKIFKRELKVLAYNSGTSLGSVLSLFLLLKDINNQIK